MVSLDQSIFIQLCNHISILQEENPPPSTAPVNDKSGSRLKLDHQLMSDLVDRISEEDKGIVVIRAFRDHFSCIVEVVL